jgi:hypothetical protein
MFNLDSLFRTLDDFCRYLNSDEGHDYVRSSVSSRSPREAAFPTFGGSPPPNLAQVWSWDAARMLFADRDGRFYIEARDPEAWYPNQK